MTLDPQTLIVWLIIGLLAGTAAGAVLSRNRRGFGWVVNLIVGLFGAVIGGLLFNLLNITLLPGISVSMDDLLAAFIGAVIFVVLVRLIQRNVK